MPTELFEYRRVLQRRRQDRSFRDLSCCFIPLSQRLEKAQIALVIPCKFSAVTNSHALFGTHFDAQD